MLRPVIMVVLLASLCFGCHHIASDYPAYLAQHPASPALPAVALDAQYRIGEATMRHSITIRSALAGYGNKWIVEFGTMLEQTMQSSEVRAAFAQLSKQDAQADTSGYGVGLELVDYQVSGFSAHVALRMVLTRGGVRLVDKVYRSDGGSQAGKVGWGGAFAMRDALHASTKQAMDAVLREFLIDAQRVAHPGSEVVAAAR